jgi:hypothetical protein
MICHVSRVMCAQIEDSMTRAKEAEMEALALERMLKDPAKVQQAENLRQRVQELKEVCFFADMTCTMPKRAR